MAAKRVAAIFGSLVFLVVAPGTVAGLVPWWISGWYAERQWLLIQVIGGVLILIGGVMLLDTFARFALEGFGTPAPVYPTRKMLITGLYRVVRNPMYVAVLALILGQALLLGSVGLLLYAVAVWLAFHLFVIGYEEPSLRRRYGHQYEQFCAAVPRWLPRLHPWRWPG